MILSFDLAEERKNYLIGKFQKITREKLFEIFEKNFD